MGCGSLAARRVDGVAVWVSRRSSRRWRLWVSRRPSRRWRRGSRRSARLPVASPGAIEAKLARGFKDLELEMGVNIDMCVYDDAEAGRWPPRCQAPCPAAGAGQPHPNLVPAPVAQVAHAVT